jgi:exodeoxyribonuclease X
VIYLAVTDTETTGVGDADQIVELAIEWLAGQSWTQRSSWLTRPGVPVTPGARAAHHITDGELSRAPTLEAWLRDVGDPFRVPDSLSARDNGEVVFVAHNAAYDRRMLVQSGVTVPAREICTWRCAMHLWPRAESHSLQSLRYELGLEVDLPVGLHPHRALYDAVVCGALVRRMFLEYGYRSAERLEELTRQPVLLETVRFGKYRGQQWANMDTGYLRWILSKDFDADVMHTARHYLEGRSGR